MGLGFPPSASKSTSGWRLLASRMLATVAALWAMTGIAQAREPSLAGGAYAIKADYLYKLTPFVAWPTGSFEGPTSPFRLCVAGRDPFGGVIDHAVRGRRVGDHPMVVVRLPTVSKGVNCHMLFLSASRAQASREMLAMVAGQPVLTVADEALEAPDAMVQFVTVGNRVRFEIRADAAQAGGLVLSSKLLALAAAPRDDAR